MAALIKKILGTVAVLSLHNGVVHAGEYESKLIPNSDKKTYETLKRLDGEMSRNKSTGATNYSGHVSCTLLNSRVEKITYNAEVETFECSVWTDKNPTLTAVPLHGETVFDLLKKLKADSSTNKSSGAESRLGDVSCEELETQLTASFLEPKKIKSYTCRVSVVSEK